MREAKPKQNPLISHLFPPNPSFFILSRRKEVSSASTRTLRFVSYPLSLFLLCIFNFFKCFFNLPNESTVRITICMLFHLFFTFFVVEIIDFLAIQLFYSRWISELSATYYRHRYRIPDTTLTC